MGAVFKYLVVTGIVMITTVCFSQPAVEKSIKAFTPLFIGDSLVHFQEFLLCADDNLFDTKFSRDSKCRSYRHLPTQTDPVNIGGVKFGNMFAHADPYQKVRQITFHQNYFPFKKPLPEAFATQDHNTLKIFFDSLFLSPGLSFTNKSGLISQTGYKWKNGKIVVVLNKTNLLKKQGGKKKFTTISVDIYKE